MIIVRQHWFIILKHYLVLRRGIMQLNIDALSVSVFIVSGFMTAA